MIEEAVVLVPRTKSRQMRMMTPQMKVAGGEEIDIVGTNNNIRGGNNQHENQQGQAAAAAATTTTTARGGGGRDQQLVFDVAGGGAPPYFPPPRPTPNTTTTNNNNNKQQIGDVVVANFDKPKSKPRPPKPISRSKSLQQPVQISLELPKGAYEMMRQVSGLGMEDPVFGLSNHSMVRAAGKSIPIIFDDMKLTDLPEDMRDLISVCSDPTASIHKDRSLHKRIRMAQLEESLHQNSSSRIGKLLSTTTTSTNNNMDISAGDQFLLNRSAACNNNTRVGRMLSTTTTTTTNNNNNRQKVISPVRNNKQRKEVFAHPFVPPQSISQLTETERQPKKELDIFRKKAKPKATGSSNILPTTEEEKPSDRRWRKSNIAEQLNNNQQQQQQQQRRSGKDEDYHHHDDDEVQVIIPSFPSKKKQPAAAKDTLSKDNLNNQLSANWQSFYWDDSRNNLDSSARHEQLLDSSARHNTNKNEQSAVSFWEESQRSRLDMSNILDMSNNLDRSNRRGDNNDELLLEELFTAGKVPTTNPQRRATHIRVSKLSTVDSNLFNGARGGRAAPNPPSRSNDFSGMELCVPNNLYFARSISGLTLDTSHGPLDDASIQNKRKPTAAKVKNKLKQHLEEGEGDREQDALIADLMQQSHQISLTLSELAKSTHHSRRSSQQRNSSSNDITGASSRLSYSATEVGENFFNHNSHNTHNTSNTKNHHHHHHHSSKKDKSKSRLYSSLDKLERKSREENHHKSRGRSKATSNKMDLIKEDSNARLARHSEEKAKARRRSYSLESTHSKTKLGNVSHRRSSATNQKGMLKTYSQDTAQRMLAFGNASLQAAEKANEIKANLTRYHRKSATATVNRVVGEQQLTSDSRPSSKRFSTFHASMAHMITAKDNSDSHDDDIQVMGNKSCGDLDFLKAMDSLMSESMHQHH